MKYLVLFAVLFVVYLLWRHERRAEQAGRTAPPGQPGRASAPSAPALPQEMVQCPVCSVHLPRADALIDAQGRTYCCAEHRKPLEL